MTEVQKKGKKKTNSLTYTWLRQTEQKSQLAQITAHIQTDSLICATPES